MPRKEFIQDYSGNEADASWSEKIAKSKKPWAKKLANLTGVLDYKISYPNLRR